MPAGRRLVWPTPKQLRQRVQASLVNEGKAAVTYAELAKRLKKHGFKEETEASITNKLKRGRFPATWFLAALAALRFEGLGETIPRI